MVPGYGLLWPAPDRRILALGPVALLPVAVVLAVLLPLGQPQAVPGSAPLKFLNG
jgi:hypothetical protein